jgi:tetratricopeptide (TPR) repeat protein
MEANLLAGLAYINTGNINSANNHIILCIERIQTRYDISKMYAFILSHFEIMPEAFLRMDEIIKHFPEFKTVYFNIGNQSFQEDHYNDAILHFNMSEKFGFISEELYFKRGWSFHLINDNKAAEQDLLKVLNSNPSYPEAAYLLGDIYRSLRLYQKAVEFYSYALYYNKNHRTALIKRFFTRLFIRDKNGILINRKEALADARRLLKLKNPVFTFRFEKGQPIQIAKIIITKNGHFSFKYVKD